MIELTALVFLVFGECVLISSFHFQGRPQRSDSNLKIRKLPLKSISRHFYSNKIIILQNNALLPFTLMAMICCLINKLQLLTQIKGMTRI